MRSRAAARRVLEALLRLARRSGYEMVRRDFYSPLPDLEWLAARDWEEPRRVPELELRIDDAAALLEERLAPLVCELEVCAGPVPPPGSTAFPLDNGGYGSVDAELLYAMTRLHAPRRVLELGSGASSHVIAAARRRAAAEGAPFEHVVVDPRPFGNPLGPVLEAELIRQRAEEMDASLVEELSAGDVLFVDTTHTVKTGGDVVRIVLDLLPRVAPGVLVHFHDVFTPYEYPRKWVFEQRRAWAEQYLLEAFLAYNESFAVVLPAYALARQRPEALRRCIPSFRPGVVPGAFWLTRR